VDRLAIHYPRHKTAPRNPGGLGFARHGGEEGAKIASACRRARGAATKRVQNRIAVHRNTMLLLIFPRYWGTIARRNGRGKALRRRKRYRFKARLRHVHWQPEEAISFAVLPERYSTSAYVG
jgi:hypothetical protein